MHLWLLNINKELSDLKIIDCIWEREFFSFSSSWKLKCHDKRTKSWKWTRKFQNKNDRVSNCIWSGVHISCSHLSVPALHSVERFFLIIFYLSQMIIIFAICVGIVQKAKILSMIMNFVCKRVFVCMCMFDEIWIIFFLFYGVRMQFSSDSETFLLHINLIETKNIEKEVKCVCGR